MQDKIIVTKHIESDNIYWMCMIFVMPMLLFFAGLLNVLRSGLEETQIMLYGLSKGMFYCTIFITLLYIGVKKF